MKQILWLLLAVSVVFSRCLEPKTTDSDISQTIEEIMTIEETQMVITEESTTAGVVEKSAESDQLDKPIIEEIPLANGAVLIIEQEKLDSNFYILYKESTEPEFLFNLWSPHIEISTDRTKFAIAFIIEYTRNLYIFDVLEQKIIEPVFDEYSYIINPTGTNDLTWLNNNILLTVGGDFHHSGSKIGDVYYYNFSDKENKMIISHPNYQIAKFEIDDDNLVLTILIKSPTFNIIYETISLTKIYKLIENKETLILDVQNIDG